MSEGLPEALARPFDEGDARSIQSKLDQKLKMGDIAQRAGPGGQKLTYLESYHAIELANDVFGFNGWSCHVLKLEKDFETNNNGRWSIGVTAIVRVQLKDGTFYTVPELSVPYDAIDGYVKSLTVPASAGGVLPTHRTTSGFWVSMHTQSIYITYAVLGIFCAIGLAYVVLVVATNNLIVASAAVLTIFAVVACVLGIMVLMGWQLGMTESICLTILAGFCVDYIVHLAHSYMECPDNSTRSVGRRSEARAHHCRIATNCDPRVHSVPFSAAIAHSDE